MASEIQSGGNERSRRSSHRYSMAGAGVSLVLTLSSIAVICTVFFRETPPFLPASWPYNWTAEVFILWGIPFFLTVWRLVAAVMEETLGGKVRDTLDRPPTP